ncbi:MAG: ISAs1 family transposase [Cyanothece sp. SIO1E1]|nr:ISAs1 family transposase [Cyanothece sp. SIO1E1]
MTAIDLDWPGLKTLIEVTRCGLRPGRPFDEVHYYISSLGATAEAFAQGIRGHWGIENPLHWVKDVVLGEERALFSAFNTATNWSIIRNMVINLARHQGYHSLTKAQRFLSHDIHSIISFLQ